MTLEDSLHQQNDSLYRQLADRDRRIDILLAVVARLSFLAHPHNVVELTQDPDGCWTVAEPRAPRASTSPTPIGPILSGE